MATETEQETWLDLVTPAARPARDDLLTREEVLQALHDRGIDVSERALVNWEKRRFLPRAVRSRREGRPVALYPEFAISGIVQLRRLQDEGLHLRAIAPKVRAHVRIVRGHEVSDVAADRARPGRIEVNETIEHALSLLARWHQQAHHGPPITQFDVHATDAAGREFVAYTYDPRFDDST